MRLVQSLGPMQSLGLLLEHPRPKQLDNESSSPGLPGTPVGVVGNQLALPPHPLQRISQSPAEGAADDDLAPLTDIVLIFIKNTELYSFFGSCNLSSLSMTKI